MAILAQMVGALEKAAEMLHHYKLSLACAGCAVAWLFSLVEVTHCSFLGSLGSRARYGLFSRSFTDLKGEHLGCIRYGGEEFDGFDSSLRAGRSFGVLTVLYLTMVVLSSTCCVIMLPRRTRLLWSVNKFLLSAAAFSQMLTLMAAGSRVCTNLEEEPCELVGVGILGIFNIVVLMLLCVTFWSLDPPQSKLLQLVAHEQRPTARADRNCIERLSYKDPTRFRMLFSGLILITMAMSAITLRRCTFLMVKATGYGPTNISSGLGLYTQAVQVQGSFVGCVAYPSSFSFDLPFKTARFFATLSILLLSGAFLAATVSLFRKDVQRRTWLIMRALLPLSSFFLLLSTTAMSSDNCSLQGVTSCRLGSSGIFLIFIALLLAFLSLVVWSQPHPASHVIEISATTKGEQDFEQQSSKDETVTVGNPRLLHKHEPIMEEEEEEISDAVEGKSKETKFRIQSPYHINSNNCGDSSSTGKGELDYDVFRDSDDESSTDSVSPSHSKAVTYKIEYIGDTKKTTKTITTSEGILSEVTTFEKVEEGSYDCGVSVESHVTG